MFYDDFLNKNELGELCASFYISCFGFENFAFEGKFSIFYFSTNKIVLNQKKQKIFIYGKNLKIESLDVCHINILGEIEIISSREVKID